MEEAQLPYTIGQANGGIKEAKEVLIFTFDRPGLPLFGASDGDCHFQLLVRGWDTHQP